MDFTILKLKSLVASTGGELIGVSDWFQKFCENIRIPAADVANIQNKNQTGADNSKLIRELSDEKKQLEYQALFYIEKITNLEKQDNHNR